MAYTFGRFTCQDILSNMRTLRNGCWKWLGKSPDSFPGCYLSVKGGSPRPIVNDLWELYRGIIPPDMVLIKKCKVKCCINPDHYHLGTVADRQLRESGGLRYWRDKKRELPKGVYRRPVASHLPQFVARLCFEGKPQHLGCFSTVKEATAAIREFHKNIISVNNCTVYK